MAKPIVALVGRPNVGKSTLFNRITGERKAIVEDRPGVTRDRIYADAFWRDREFILVDTGGIEFEVEDEIARQVKKQARLALEEADVVVFLTDGREGLTPLDREVANLLRRTRKPVILAVNKVENFQKADIYDFYQLGLGDPIPISAAHGLNTGDLLDAVVANLPPKSGEEYDEEVIKIAVAGRPNVGKSSLVNAILGEERVIVSDIPGTTRDAVDTLFTRDGQSYVIIDTAGIRRRSKIEESTERFSVIRALRAIERADVVLLVLDAQEGVTEQDKRIAGYAHEKGRAIVIVVNKWDLVEKDDKTMLRYTERIREELSFMQYAPVVYVSALTGQRVPRILELVKYVAEQHVMRVATSTLNEVIREAVALNPPPAEGGHRLKILYATQTGVRPPTFVIFVNDPELVHFSYARYLENRIRSSFGFEGTPINLIFRQRRS